MKQPKVRSDYNTRESFSFEKAPTEFKSVTEKSINDIKEYCRNLIKENYNDNFEPSALYAMVGSVIGNFDLLTSRLNDDYHSRLGNLKQAQNQGIKKATKKLSLFETLVVNHEIALKRHHDNLIDYDGCDMTESLHFSTSKLEGFKKRLSKVEEKNHEA